MKKVIAFSTTLVLALFIMAQVCFGQAKQQYPKTWENLFIPGMEEFAFSFYGIPSNDIDDFKEFTSLLKNGGLKGLANYLDPGPNMFDKENLPLFEYMADIGLNASFTPTPWLEDSLPEIAVRNLNILETKGLNPLIQFGEWGYSFHNLNGGYEVKVKTKKECHDYLKAEYQQQMVNFRNGKGNSVTGHSHYEIYAAQWPGTQMIGLEVGENIAFTQSKIAFARGASRQNGVPWSLQMSPWWKGKVTTWDNPDYGHSISLYQRMLKHGWFAGAGLVTPENSINIVFNNNDPKEGLNDWGKEQARTYAFIKTHDRGIAFTPVALVMDYYTGYNGYEKAAWGQIKYSKGDHEIRRLFQDQLFPKSDHIYFNPFPGSPEKTYLRPTPYGEIFDVLLSNASSEVLASYPVIVLVGDIDFTFEMNNNLLDAVVKGSRLLIHPRHKEEMGYELKNLISKNIIEVLDVEKGKAISDNDLKQIADSYLPVVISGDPVQYQVNKNREGWVIELIHNSGVKKTPGSPAKIDRKDTATITITSREKILEVKEWGIDEFGNQADKLIGKEQKFQVTIGPGEAKYIQLVTK